MGREKGSKIVKEIEPGLVFCVFFFYVSLRRDLKYKEKKQYLKEQIFSR